MGRPDWDDRLSAVSVDSVGEVDPTDPTATAGTGAAAKVNKQVSIAHELLQADRCVFFSIDLEHGGDRAGILQLSAEAFSKNGERLGDTFDEYVKPPAGAPIPATQTAVHGLSLADRRIQNADTIEQVWPRFVAYIEGKLDGGSKKGVMVAWGGKACDCEWLFRVTEVWHPETLHMPAGLDYFLDPGRVIENYKSCRLHNQHTGLEGYGLEMTWCYIKGETELQHAHSSLVDCKAQTDVVLDERFLPFIDRYKSMVPIDTVFVSKRKKAMQREKELSRKVPVGWTEDDTTTYNTDTNQPPRSRRYSGPQGGGESGPSSQVKTAISQDNPISKDPLQGALVNLFLFIWPLWLLKLMANMSEKYARADWVKPLATTDVDGNPRKRPIFVPCGPDDPERRHRHNDEKTWKTITVGYVLAFIAILMLRGANGVRCATLFWQEAPYGSPNQFVRNLMPRDNYLRMRRFLHFVDNESLPRNSADPKWHPLQKILPVLKAVQSTMQAAWTLGERITIDETMILYNGRAIKWVQFMPRKPIKHGMKAFALCDARTGVLVAFLIYYGKELARAGDDWSAIGVVDKLLDLAGLVALGAGRTLYTDNWYTSIALMEHLYFRYGFYLVGTIVLTSKLSRTAADFPFHKLSNAALRLVPRGWGRRATREFKGQGRDGSADRFVGQATVWRDKKQVGIVHNKHVEPFGTHSVKRYSKDSRKREEIPSAKVVSDYGKNYSAVDRIDRDTSDWTVSVQTNRFYLRIEFWLLDTTIHLMYHVAIETKPEWRDKYGDKNDGRRRFQIDLALALADYAIRHDWEGDLDDENGRPAWMRQQGPVPCDCGECFFCKTGRTNGITHNTVTKPPPRRQVPQECDEERTEIRREPQTLCSLLCHCP